MSEYNLPRIIKRDRRYADGRPHEAVETEALRQTVLMDILRSRLDEFIPEPLARVQEREARQRQADLGKDRLTEARLSPSAPAPAAW